MGNQKDCGLNIMRMDIRCKKKLSKMEKNRDYLISGMIMDN